MNEEVMKAIGKLVDPPGLNIFQLEQYWAEKVRITKERNERSQAALSVERQISNEMHRLNSQAYNDVISQRLDQVTVVTNTHEKRLDEMVVHQDALIAKVERLNEMEAMDREEEERYERCRKEIAEKYSDENQAIEFEKLKMLTEKAEKHLEKSKQKLAALEAKMERRKEEQRLYDEMIITIAAKVTQRNELQAKLDQLILEKQEKDQNSPEEALDCKEN